MKQFLITVAGVLVGLILFLIVVPIFLVGALAGGSERAPTIAANSVLQLDLREDFADQPSSSPFSIGGLSLIEMTRRLEAAADDKRVKGVVVRATAWGMAPAHADELRDALAKFRESGKFVIAHLQNDAVNTSLSGYAAIAGADEVWAQPNDHVLPMGVSSERLFLGGTLRKFRAEAQFEKREDQKSAPEVFTQERLTPPARADLEKIYNGWLERFYTIVAADREITPEQVRAAVEATPFTTERGRELKLFDQLGYPEDAVAAALARAGEDAELVELADYKPTPPDGPVIALVGGEGGISSGPDDPGLFGEEEGMNSDRLAEAIDEAADDEDVRAIIFRVNSPGGTVTGSDQILAAVERARAAGKKVVVSMGPVAASGGYWVSASADEIVAGPSTITGSIGIFSGKLVLGRTLQYYAGATTDTVSVGSPMINWATADRPWTNAERQAVARLMDDGYASFLRTVSEGRKMTVEQVRAIAGGRVYTGEQAKAIGLVDHVGGLAVAVERAKALAEIAPETDIALRVFPEPRNPIEELQEAFGVSAQAAAGAAALAGVLGDAQVVAALREVMDERRGAVRAEAELMEAR